MFHWSPIKLRAGSVIEPGNFGRMLKRYAPNQFGNAWLLARELVFEMSREVYAPNAPSRFDACFVCPTRDGADRYRQENDGNSTWCLHEVEFVDDQAPQHTAYLEHLVTPNNAPFLDPSRLRARDYWQGAGQGDREILTASPLRVLQALV